MPNRRERNQSLGRFGEIYAAHFLEKMGYEILARNQWYRVGEIDIIARQGGELVFIEVKTRGSVTYATPEDAITSERLDHLESAITEYLAGRDTPYRIEVVAIEIDGVGRVSRCEVMGDVGA